MTRRVDHPDGVATSFFKHTCRNFDEPMSGAQRLMDSGDWCLFSKQYTDDGQIRLWVKNVRTDEEAEEFYEPGTERQRADREPILPGEVSDA